MAKAAVNFGTMAAEPTVARPAKEFAFGELFTSTHHPYKLFWRILGGAIHFTADDDDEYEVAIATDEELEAPAFRACRPAKAKLNIDVHMPKVKA